MPVFLVYFVKTSCHVVIDGGWAISLSVGEWCVIAWRVTLSCNLINSVVKRFIFSIYGYIKV